MGTRGPGRDGRRSGRASVGVEDEGPSRALLEQEHLLGLLLKTSSFLTILDRVDLDQDAAIRAFEASDDTEPPEFPWTPAAMPASLAAMHDFDADVQLVTMAVLAPDRVGPEVLEGVPVHERLAHLGASHAVRAAAGSSRGTERIAVEVALPDDDGFVLVTDLDPGTGTVVDAHADVGPFELVVARSRIDPVEGAVPLADAAVELATAEARSPMPESWTAEDDWPKTRPLLRWTTRLAAIAALAERGA